MSARRRFSASTVTRGLKARKRAIVWRPRRAHTLRGAIAAATGAWIGLALMWYAALAPALPVGAADAPASWDGDGVRGTDVPQERRAVT